MAGALVAAVGQSAPTPIEWYRLEVEKLHAPRVSTCRGAAARPAPLLRLRRRGGCEAPAALDDRPAEQTAGDGGSEKGAAAHPAG